MRAPRQLALESRSSSCTRASGPPRRRHARSPPSRGVCAPRMRAPSRVDSPVGRVRVGKLSLLFDRESSCCIIFGLLPGSAQPAIGATLSAEAEPRTAHWIRSRDPIRHARTRSVRYVVEGARVLQPRVRACGWTDIRDRWCVRLLRCLRQEFFFW